MGVQLPISLKDLPDWPAALDAHEALAYTRLSETEMRRRVDSGAVVFKALGVNGKKVCPRTQLDELLRTIWAEQSGLPPVPSKDLDFGDD